MQSHLFVIVVLFVDGRFHLPKLPHRYGLDFLRNQQEVDRI